MDLFKWFKRKHKQATPPEKDHPLIDQNGEIIDDPILTQLVNEAYRTGDTVIWNEGKDPPRVREYSKDPGR